METKELLGILRLVKPGLASKEIIEQTANFVFNKHRVYTYNDEIMISHELPEGLIGFKGAVLAAPLYNLLSRVEDNEIEIEVIEEEMIITGRMFDARLRLQEEVLLPIEDVPVPKRWFSLPKKMKEAMKLCLSSASKDASKPVLTCIHFAEHYIESCDTFRLTRCGVNGSFVQEILVPSRVAEELIKYDFAHYAVIGGWAHFKDENGTWFSARIVEEEYPDLDRFINIDDYEKVNFEKLTLDVLNRAEVLAKDDLAVGKVVTVNINKRVMTIRSSGDSGTFSERIRLKDSIGKDISFNIGPNSLNHILQHLLTAIVGEGKMKFVGNNFVYVIALLKEEE